MLQSLFVWGWALHGAGDSLIDWLNSVYWIGQLIVCLIIRLIDWLIDCSALLFNSFSFSNQHFSKRSHHDFWHGLRGHSDIWKHHCSWSIGCGWNHSKRDGSLAPGDCHCQSAASIVRISVCRRVGSTPPWAHTAYRWIPSARRNCTESDGNQPVDALHFRTWWILSSPTQEKVACIVSHHSWCVISISPLVSVFQVPFFSKTCKIKLQVFPWSIIHIQKQTVCHGRSIDWLIDWLIFAISFILFTLAVFLHRSCSPAGYLAKTVSRTRTTLRLIQERTRRYRWNWQENFRPRGRWICRRRRECRVL